MPRIVGPQEAQTVVTRIFAVIGQITKAAVIELLDGSRTLAVLEQFAQGRG